MVEWEILVAGVVGWVLGGILWKVIGPKVLAWVNKGKDD